MLTDFKSKQTEILQEIKATDVSILHPTLDRSELCKALVAQYLSHDGYNETAKAFAREVRSEELALRGPGRQRFSLELYLAGVDDSDAAHRQRKFICQLSNSNHREQNTKNI